MNLDPVEQLLRQADERTNVRSSEPTGLAARVLEVASRRRQRRRTAVVLVLVIGLMPGVFILRQMRTKPVEVAIDSKPVVDGRVEPVASPVDPTLKDRLHGEIAQQERLIERMLLAERNSEQRGRLTELQSLPTEEDVTERAASAMVFQADRLVQHAGESESAVRSYSSVIDHFPRTIAADVARKRVAEFKKEG